MEVYDTDNYVALDRSEGHGASHILVQKLRDEWKVTVKSRDFPRSVTQRGSTVSDGIFVCLFVCL